MDYQRKITSVTVFTGSDHMDEFHGFLEYDIIRHDDGALQIVEHLSDLVKRSVIYAPGKWATLDFIEEFGALDVPAPPQVGDQVPKP